MRFFKHFKFTWRYLALVTLVCVGSYSQAGGNDASNNDPDRRVATKSSFNQIVDAVFSDPYETLPFYKVTKKQFGKSGDHPNNYVFQAATRSLLSDVDLYQFPNGQKIFQANGICFSGRWLIHDPSGYTGLFQKGTNVPVIARASVALDGTLQKHKRAFGMAVKLFPHSNPDQTVSTVNLFVMNSLGGVKTQYVLDLTLDNAPALGALPPFNKWRTMLRLQRDFTRADHALSGEKSDITYRPVRHLAAVDSNTGEPIANGIFPTWVRLSVDANTPRIDQNDFRDELRIDQYPDETLVWQIDVAKGEGSKKKQAQWSRIGSLELTQSVRSKTCDQQLHFQHPKGN